MTDSLKKLTTIIMAGGKGERLFPLTRDKAKPVITFGSLYRIIDFTLSRPLTSGTRRIYVLSQYGSFSLDQHLRQAWDIMHPDLDEFIYSMPPQQIMVTRWYRGTADSIFQNLNLLEAGRAKWRIPWKTPGTRRDCPTTPTSPWCPWGFTSSTPESWWRRSSRTPRT